MNRIKRIRPEAFIWLLALILLAIMNPEAQHLSLCPLKNLGFAHCPGCGLGHSITYIFHGQFLNSIQAHPFGGFAIIILIFRIIHLIKESTTNLEIKNISNE